MEEQSKYTDLIFIEKGSELLSVVPDEQRFLYSRLGYKMEVKREDGEWLNEIIWLDDIGKATIIRTENWFTLDVELNEVLSMMLSQLLANYLGSTINSYGKAIGYFTSNFTDKNKIENAFNKALKRIQEPHELKALKTLSEYLIASEFSHYDFNFHSKIMKLSIGLNQNSYASLFTLDAELGPFVNEEMAILNNAIKNHNIHLEDRVILCLLITFGLRPIQISLLKQSDLVTNDISGIHYLNIPRVKQNTVGRRDLFTKRLLTSDLAMMISELIDTHKTVFSHLNIEDPPLIMRRIKGFIGHSHPYRQQRSIDRHFNSDLTEMAQPVAAQKYQELYENNDKSDSGYHLSNQGITFRLKSITDYLPNSPRTNRPFNLFPYRFRYTLGTNAVIEGKTEAEVMDLLDHSAQGSVKHYFRYTHEMNEILNQATNKRVEQQHFVAAWTREGDQTNNIYGQEIVEKKYFTSIGKCQKGSFCSFEPAVACYECDKFCPNKDSDAHKKALETLNERRQELQDTSTGVVVHQLDSAIAGCHAAIAFSEGEDVQFLEVNNTNGGLVND